MSAELEMLRTMAAAYDAYRFVSCPECDMVTGFNRIDDLRAILARLEAAERVCESCDETDEYHYRFDVNALRAYRVLDGKGEG